MLRFQQRIRLETLHRSCSALSPSSLADDSFLPPGYGEPELSEVLWIRLCQVWYPIREVDSPVHLPIFSNRAEVADGVQGTSGSDLPISETTKDKSYAWSRGLGLELSPIKTRSARKRAGPTLPTASTSIPSTCDLGALRGLKSLARAKS
jgi:hypothetical protein